MVLTSLKTSTEIGATPATLLPHSWRFGNYPDAFGAAPFGVYVRNSFIIATSHSLVNVLIASMAGYALARLRFRGNKVIFYAFVAALMIPTYTKILPEFLIVRFMPLTGGNDLFGVGGTGGLDSWWALIIPGAVTPFAVFLFRQFYLGLPRELEDAARLDGAGELQIFARVMLPLTRPALATVGIFVFLQNWNEFLFALTFITEGRMRTLPTGIYALLSSEFYGNYPILAASLVLFSVPVLALYFLFQQQFIEGLTAGALKQ
jgi:multiple sugar transport system permease protein